MLSVNIISTVSTDDHYNVHPHDCDDEVILYSSDECMEIIVNYCIVSSWPLMINIDCTSCQTLEVELDTTSCGKWKGRLAVNVNI